MKNNLELQKKIDAALHSINKVQPAVPSPYFYTKVLTKISKTRISTWEKWSTFFLRPTIAFATICFIVVINVFVLYSKYEPNVSLTDQTELSSLDEYNESVTAIYDLENIKP